MKPKPYNAAGSTFLLIDGFEAEWPDDPSGTAREICGSEAQGCVGLLLVGPPRNAGDVRLITYRRDGTRAALSGNGLRCVALHMRESGRVRKEETVIETDSGHRRVYAQGPEGGEQTPRVDMGLPQILEARRVVDLEGERVEVTLVNTGSLHCVVFVEESQLSDFDRLAPSLASFPGFTEGVHVHFAAPRGTALVLRSWIGGVGEVPSSGSGACAVAVAGIQMGLAVSPVWVESPGGTVEVAWKRWGNAQVSGPVQVGRAPVEKAPEKGTEKDTEKDTEQAPEEASEQA